MIIGSFKDKNPSEKMKILRLLFEAERNVEMNYRDKEFEKRGGAINYFLDANVVSHFISPNTEGPFGEYGELSGQSENRDVVMMVTTGYIFSPISLCNRRAKLFMTPWHRSEVVDILYEAKKEAAIKLLMQEGSDAIGRHQEMKRKSLSATKTHADFVDVCNYQLEHNAVSTIGLIDRISKGIFPDLSHADNEADGFGPSVRKEFKISPADFFLSEEYALFDELKLIISRKKPNASKLVVDHDAYSICFLHWLASSRAEGAERFALITADRALYLAYAEWHHRSKVERDFIVRGIAQYLPQINIVDSGVLTKFKNGQDLNIAGHPVSSVYQRIREALSVVINRVNVFFLDSYKGIDFRSVDSDFLDKLDPDLIEAIDEAISSLAAIEASSVYIYDGIIAKRFPGDSYFKVIATENERKNQVRKLLEDCQSYHENTLEKILISIEEFDPSNKLRIPRTVWYKIRGKDLSDDIEQLIGRRSIVKREASGEHSYCDIFATYFKIGISSYQKRRARILAKDCAELCLYSYKAEKTVDPSIEAEIHFMCAIAYRFMLGGSVDPHSADKRYQSAVDHLDNFERLSGDRYRSESERCALVLFNAARIHEFTGGTASYLICEVRGVRARLTFLLEESEKSHESLHGSVMRQIKHNIASTFVIALLMVGSHKEKAAVSFGYELDEYEKKDEIVDFISHELSEENSGNSVDFHIAELSFFLGMAVPVRRRENMERCLACSQKALKVAQLQADKWQLDLMVKECIRFFNSAETASIAR